MFRSRLITILIASAAASGIAVTIFWFSSTGTGYVRTHASELTLALALACVLTTANLVVRWGRWNFLVRRLELRVPTREGVRLYFATLPTIATPFYVGELIRGHLLATRFHGARAVIGLVWLVERASDVMALLLFLLVARRQWTWAGALVAVWLSAMCLFQFVRPGRTREFARPAVIAAVFASTLGAWAIAIAALSVTLRIAGEPASYRLASEAMTSGTLLGGTAGIPLGTAVAGSMTIVVLHANGIPSEAAAALVAVFRAGTSWYAVGLGLLTLVMSRRRLVAFLRGGRPQDHFDDLAAEYEEQIPAHIRERLLDRKIAFMQARLERASIGAGARGLDIGCGQGWYACEMALRGYHVEALDQSADQVAQARRHAAARGCDVRFEAVDAERLPFPDASFDFAYSINVVHHIIDPQKRGRALAEIVRVLRPGGVFFLHEINTHNPLFRLYMSYLFPLMCQIDEGTERWIKPTDLPRVAGATWSPEVDYFTFLPDFTPKVVLEALRGLEAWLERSPVRSWSAHYVASLWKDKK